MLHLYVALPNLLSLLVDEATDILKTLPAEEISSSSRVQTFTPDRVF